MKKIFLIFSLLMLSVLLIACESNNSKTYTITFDAGFDYEIAEQYLKAGDKVTIPELPDRVGFEFSYWDLNGLKFNEQLYTVYQNIKLVAIWRELPEYQVTFNTAGGTQVATITLFEGDKVVKPQNPLRTNFEFVQWQLNGVLYDFDLPVTSNITLVAIWKSVEDWNIETTFKNELATYIEKVICNQHLALAIETIIDYDSLTETNYQEQLVKAKIDLFSLEKADVMVDELKSDLDYLSITDINLLRPYAYLKLKDYRNLIYHYDLSLIDDSYKIDVGGNYFLYDENKVLINNASLEIAKLTSNKKVYVVNIDGVYEIELKEFKGAPYVINPIIYSDFSENAIFQVESLGYNIELADSTLAEHIAIDGNLVIVDSEYLVSIFAGDRETLFFAIIIDGGMNISSILVSVYRR